MFIIHGYSIGYLFTNIKMAAEYLSFIRQNTFKHNRVFWKSNFLQFALDNVFRNIEMNLY